MPGPLGQSLQAVSRAISARTTLPILNNILLQATDQGLALTATAGLLMAHDWKDRSMWFQLGAGNQP